jgi:hypothetical protein
MNGISIRQGCSQISELFHPSRGCIISLYVAILSCILVLREVDMSASIDFILSYPLPFKIIRPPGPRPLLPCNRIIFLLKKYVHLEHCRPGARPLQARKPHFTQCPRCFYTQVLISVQCTRCTPHSGPYISTMHTVHPTLRSLYQYNAHGAPTLTLSFQYLLCTLCSY